MKSEIHIVQIDNPSFSPQHAGEKWNTPKTTARKNIRESAVETMFARKSIDAAQKEAADRFRALCEAMGAAGARAFDYTRVRVDGGLRGQAEADKALDAGAAMKRCHDVLDRIDRGAFNLLWRIVGTGSALSELGLSVRDQRWARALLSSGLDALAVHWGLKTAETELPRPYSPMSKAPESISVRDAATLAKKSPDCIKRWILRYGIGYRISPEAPWRVDPIGLDIVLSADALALTDYQRSAR
ncbi:hypothetical protein [Phyllobacterium sp. 22552]|uniref:hypothetical protein n=1 Tax=Phyllobacterium sp. 22552 TaxID=3453941 RepID=UPI003F837B1D